MLNSCKLSAMPYANAHVERRANRVVLVSYTTPVAEIVGGILLVHGLYSMTTRRHIGAFVREYCGLDYATARACYERKQGYDLARKEFVF